MKSYVGHPSPVYRPVPSVMLHVELDSLDGGERFEQLWTKKIADDQFEVACIPFFAYDIALGDVVAASAETGYLVQGVVSRSGNGVVRVAVVDARHPDDVHPRLHDILERLTYKSEWLAPGYVAINLDAGRDHGDLLAELDKLGPTVQIERF